MQIRPAFVLAGGRSSRMGRPKSQLPFQKTTLLEHALDTLRGAGFTASVAGLPAGIACSVPLVTDAFKDCGPLGGIEAALRSLAGHPPQPALFLPVDLPLLPGAFLQGMWERAKTTVAWATVPCIAGRPQPLCAVYDSRLAPGIADALQQADGKVMRVLSELVPEPHFDLFRIEALAAMPGWSDPHRWFTNLNTPADWQAFERTLE